MAASLVMEGRGRGPREEGGREKKAVAGLPPRAGATQVAASSASWGGGRHSCLSHYNLGMAQAVCAAGAQFEGVEPLSLADEGRQIKMSCPQLSPASTLLVC